MPQAARIPKAVPVSNATGLPVAEALVQAVARSQGRDRAAIVAEALPNMKTTSDDPRKTAQTRLGQLIAEEIRLVERDGLVYLK